MESAFTETKVDQIQTGSESAANIAHAKREWLRRVLGVELSSPPETTEGSADIMAALMS
jgi:hypothetical protein